MRKLLSLSIIALLMVAIVGISSAQETPSVTVGDQVSTDGTVTVASAGDGPGFVVIHADNGEGAPGPVIGFRSITAGENSNVVIPIDVINATTTLFAMLHTDDNEIGTYEFGTVEGADGPVTDAEGNVITPSFSVDIMQTTDQFIGDDGLFTVDIVVANAPGFVVLHADNGEGAPGPVIGFTQVQAGTTAPVDILIDGDATDTLFPMLHVDTGEEGVYEFGEVEGADGPVAVDGAVLTFPVVTVPNMRVPNQIAFGSDAKAGMTPTLTADQVLSDGPGWLVVHADNDGSPGPVLGVAPVSDGINMNVNVELDTEGLTPVLWPMLHVDTGESEVYEFGEVEGADGPVMVNDSVLTFPVNGAPSITYSGTLDGTTLTVEEAVIDGVGWLAIHADNGDGGPGPVIGVAPLLEGPNVDITVELDESGMTETVFPMLHYDTGEVGVYEFGEVEGADGPVVVQGDVVVGPLTPESTME